MARSIALVVLSWLIAAILVLTLHSIALQSLAIVVVAFAYMSIAKTDLNHALAAGAAWLVLGIVAELIAAAITGHNRFALLGPPQHVGLHYALLFLWVASPVFFVRARG
jgi:E3 ubiquitin-protein ligase DOA10